MNNIEIIIGLLLFQVSLEIDLPRPRELPLGLRFALPWALAQGPIVLLPVRAMEIGWVASLLGCGIPESVAVGMAYPAWNS